MQNEETTNKNQENPDEPILREKFSFEKEKKLEDTVKKFEEKGKILNIKKKTKYKTVDELFEQSQPSSVYYTLLIISVFIITCGLLLENAPIVIGGMLVTPILTPILVIALSIIVAETGALRRPLILLLKSTLITIAVSFILTIIFGMQAVSHFFVNDLRTAVLYFIIAASSGVAATFAWVRKEVSDILPGVSIAVSLVPPISLIGISLGTFEFDNARFFLTIFLLNLIGIIVGSMVIFSLLRFQKAGWELKRKVQEVEEIEKIKKAKEQAKKTLEQMEQVKKNVSTAIKMEKEVLKEKGENKDASPQETPKQQE
jgi:uncharacterized hydrophobic protein (TIGR00271 family)